MEKRKDMISNTLLEIWESEKELEISWVFLGRKIKIKNLTKWLNSSKIHLVEQTFEKFTN